MKLYFITIVQKDGPDAHLYVKSTSPGFAVDRAVIWAHEKGVEVSSIKAVEADHEFIDECPE